MQLKAYAPAVVALLAATHLASPAAAQFGGLRNLVPGASTSGAAATDPDAFLAETIETTKMMMVAAALLAQASSHDGDRDALRAEIAAIQGSSSIDELNTHTDSFRENAKILEANASDAATLQAQYDAASKDQQEMMLNAAFNFSLAMMRNAQLGQQAPQLMGSLRSNPMMLTKLGSIRAAGSLVGQQIQATRSMAGPMRTLLSRGGVEMPADASTAEARVIPL